MNKATLLRNLATFAALFVVVSESAANNYNGNLSGAGSVGTTSGAFSVDAFTGVATGSYPIAIPPGRAGMQPDLTLTYNSGSLPGWFLGRGWSLPLATIGRST